MMKFSLVLAVAASGLMPASTWAASPSARLADLAWLVGTWEGRGIGGAPSLESYTRPAGDQMVGHFRQLNANGTVMFYELITIVEEGRSLSYRLKHFNSDLTGWEEKNEVRAFPLSAVAKNEWTFSGLTYQRTGVDRMVVRVKSKGADGKDEMLNFTFRRRR